MHLSTRNVNEAFQTIIEGIDDQTIPTIQTPSRNGPVIQIEGPIIVTYTNPRERVLFNQARDQNCFFTLYESLWMLAGRNNVAPLDYYMGGKYSAFSDDGVTANGAYGYRWRSAMDKDREGNFYSHPIDQLKIIIDHLKRKPESRRVVLQMWNVEDDLLKIDSSKDVCCNTSVMFSLREAPEQTTGPPIHLEPVNQRRYYLDMTVTNRSNDLIWGMMGANYVHFGFLQEYVACALGVEVGHYHQMSNNAHVYTETNSGWHPDKWLAEYKRTMHSPPILSYGRGPNDATGNVGTSPLLFAGDETVEQFDKEVQEFVELNKNSVEITRTAQWNIRFLDRTAQPMMHAFHMYKQRDFEAALEWCDDIAGADWRVAATNWIEKRQRNAEKKAKFTSNVQSADLSDI